MFLFGLPRNSRIPPYSPLGDYVGFFGELYSSAPPTPIISRLYTTGASSSYSYSMDIFAALPLFFGGDSITHRHGDQYGGIEEAGNYAAELRQRMWRLKSHSESYEFDRCPILATTESSKRWKFTRTLGAPQKPVSSIENGLLPDIGRFNLPKKLT